MAEQLRTGKALPTNTKMPMPSFPKPARSELFSKLQAFLPVMEQENKNLQDAVAEGRGDEHNIEIEEQEEVIEPEDDTTDEVDDDNKKPKKQIIEMNFALGMIADSDANDNSDSDEDEDEPMELEQVVSTKQQLEACTPSIQLPTATAAKKPLIQELN